MRISPRHLPPVGFIKLPDFLPELLHTGKYSKFGTYFETREKAMRPYIGVTGFMDRNEVETVLSGMPVEPNRQLMVGVLVSWKTINGTQNKWPHRYPTPPRVREIFSDDPRALNLIHYNTKDPGTLCDQLRFISEQFAGKACHGFQLNVCWPNPRQLERYYATTLTKYIVLQIGSQAFEMVGHSPTTLAHKIRHQYPMVE